MIAKLNIENSAIRTKDIMNADLGRPSPLDELRNRSSYFPDMSHYTDNGSVNTLSVLQDESQHPYKKTNHSVLSFETVHTAERLLDKLDLSAEDEALLQQALQEEEERNREYQRKQQKGPIICMPASKFPSLRAKGLSASRELDYTVKKLSTENLKLQGNLSSSKVEQHYATKSRYSYLVEEDSDSDGFEYRPVSSHNQSTKTQQQIHPNSNLDRNTHFDDASCGRQSENNNVVNFEKYRMENSKLFHYYPQLIFGGKHSKNHDQQIIGSQIEHFDSVNEKTPMKNGNLYRNGSSNSTITSFAEGGQLSKPKTQSSIESEASSDASARAKEGGQSIHVSTPKKSTSSPTIDSSFLKEISKEPVVPYKAHRKKSSFSLKGFFRSPKSSKSKSFLPSRDSIEDNSHVYRQSQSSLESSPRKPTQQLRKFIFPANPTFHVKPGAPPKEMRAKNQHFRSLSDFHKVSPQYEDQAAKDSHYQGKNLHPYRNRRKLSLDSRKPSLPVSSFVTPPHSRQRSENCLQLNAVKNEEGNFAAGSADKSSSNATNQIEMAIHMRNEGRAEESAKRLQKACMTKDKMAYLLYGLALRNGSGVAKDYKESFRYIRDAAGIHSEDEEVFNFNVDPFQLEKDNDIPEIVPEPLAPALYECGIAYLKGYGFDSEDEVKGLKYLEKAASLGHIDSICLSGTICSKKSSVRKRDISRAASWFRLAEKRGANLIGSEWIHKEKYLKAST